MKGIKVNRETLEVICKQASIRGVSDIRLKYKKGRIPWLKQYGAPLEVYFNEELFSVVEFKIKK